jgi:hypothetical protein
MYSRSLYIARLAKPLSQTLSCPRLQPRSMSTQQISKPERTDPASVPNPLGEGNYIKWVTDMTLLMAERLDV